MPPLRTAARAMSLAMSLLAREAAAETLALESAGSPLTVEVQSETAPTRRCETPCSLEVAAGTYRVSARAPGVIGSDLSVVVPPEGARVVLRADRKSGRVWGVVLVSLGGAMFVVGGTMTAVIVAGNSYDSYNTAMLVAMGSITAAGAAQLIPGLLLLTSHRGGLADPSAMASPTPPPLLGRGLVPTMSWRF